MMTNKIYFVSLGCDKNRVDSEEMLGYLKEAGFSFTYDENEADVIVVNTCAFIDPAKEESIETILEMAACKETGNCKKLIVAGCLAERYADEIMKEMPEIDAIIGVNEISRIADVVKRLYAEESVHLSGKENVPFPAIVSDDNFVKDNIEKPARVLTTGGHYEFLKIAEGCNKCCTYCVIPKIRGRYRSFPMDEILKEAEYLADAGVKELILVAQETSIYGRDLYGKDMLPDLLQALCRIEGIEWIRLLYAYPEDITTELLQTMASEKKICHYIDMPIQHASDRILKRMGRRTSKQDILSVIATARNLLPDIALRTSLISGFPGETEEDHQELLAFVKEVQFDRLGVFTYSQEDGTPAAAFPDQIPEEIKQRRRDEIMALQEQISREKLKHFIGHELDVFIEGKLVDDDVFVGRTYMDAPDVDGCIFVNCKYDLMSGSIVKAKVTETSDYDMSGIVQNG